MMADTDSKEQYQGGNIQQLPSDAPATSRSPLRPGGWMYKGFRLGRTELWYASPRVQLVMVSFVCFLCPGMFNALSGLGGAGLDNPKAQDHANTALYSTFAVVGFFAGTIVNKAGIKISLGFGGIGYCIYAASFLCYAHTRNIGFNIFAGALLGVCAGVLWAAQGAIMMSYPREADKGRYISWFWMIFNLGAVIGSVIPLAQNFNNSSRTVTDGTYAAFIALMFLGAIVAVSLCNAGKVIREDGSKVILMKNPSWWSELRGLWETLESDPWIVLLFPIFFSSNTFYTYQFNGFNGAGFNTRTRSLNNLLYWLSQIMGAWVFGYALDYKGIRRTVRSRVCFVALTALTFAIWGGGYAWQKTQPPRSVISRDDYDGHADLTDGGKRYVGPMFLFMFYGFYDAAWQTAIYWWMGAISNSGRKTANMAGFYKGIQSAGAAIFWRLDGLGKDYMTLFGATVSVL